MIVNRALYLRRRARQCGLHRPVARRGPVRPGLAGLHPGRAAVKNGIAALSPTLFTEVTPPPGSAGGLANAILGSVMMSVGAVLLGTPIGLFAGTYLAEYGRHGAARLLWCASSTTSCSVGALHRHRPVHLRDRGGADGPFLRLGRRRCR